MLIEHLFCSTLCTRDRKNCSRKDPVSAFNKFIVGGINRENIFKILVKE
jgi:hypothetical protein